MVTFDQKQFTGEQHSQCSEVIDGTLQVAAGTIADGSATIEEVGWELFRLMLEVASGRKKTWAEHWKLHNALVLFNPAPVT